MTVLMETEENLRFSKYEVLSNFLQLGRGSHPGRFAFTILLLKGPRTNATPLLTDNII